MHVGLYACEQHTKKGRLKIGLQTNGGRERHSVTDREIEKEREREREISDTESREVL